MVPPRTPSLPLALDGTMESIPKERAEAFAEALIKNAGNATAAARSLGYTDPRGTGHRYSRHPLVLKALVSVRKEVKSLESVVILCQAPALEVLYVDIEEPLPV